MDVRAHLRGLGWKGDGHSLGKHADGIKKPLLISQRRSQHGLGAKTQKQNQADQWWLNAFDNALKDIGTGKETALSKIQSKGSGRGGLYGFFIRGQSLDGTISSSQASTITSGAPTPPPTNAMDILTPRDVASESTSEAKNNSKRKKQKSSNREKTTDSKSRKRRHQEAASQLTVVSTDGRGLIARDSGIEDPKIPVGEGPSTTAEVLDIGTWRQLSKEERRQQRQQRRLDRAERRAARAARRRRRQENEMELEDGLV